MDKKVLEEENYVAELASIIQRDYFPQLSDKVTAAALPALDSYFATRTSEDNEAFRKLQEKEVILKDKKFNQAFKPKASNNLLPSTSALMYLPPPQESEDVFLTPVPIPSHTRLTTIDEDTEFPVSRPAKKAYDFVKATPRGPVPPTPHDLLRKRNANSRPRSNKDILRTPSIRRLVRSIRKDK